MTDPWIPYVGEPPAFTVQRAPYSDVLGGDYVRGGPGLPKTAVRYRVSSPSTQELATQSTLVATVRSYSSIDLTWGWPVKYVTWQEVSLVRSGFGHPSTVNDGVTIFRTTRTGFTDVDINGAPLSIVVSDDELPSGRFYYYTLFFFTAGEEWVPALTASALVPRNWGHQEHLWNALPPYYQWVDARFRADDGFLRQFLNTFGFELDQTREYIESWQEAYHIDVSPIPLLRRVGENLGLSYEAGLGEIRYRALVQQVSQLYERRGTPEGIRQLIEVSSKYETLLQVGRNLMLLPDDSEFTTGQGNWVLGGGGPPANTTTGVATGAGSSYNATVINNATFVYAGVATATGTATTNTPGFIPGPGAGDRGYTSTLGVTAASGTGVAYNAGISYPIVIEAPYQTDDRSPGYGRGVLNVNVPVEIGTRDVIVLAGVGTLYTPLMQAPKVLTPKLNGIPIKQDSLYGFSVRYKSHSTGVGGIYWYGRNETLISLTELLTPSPGEWQTLTAQGQPPVGAYYAVPYVRQTNRTAGDDFMLMGAMFYRVGDVGSVTALAPDFYLTLGSLDELIGVGGKVIGDA